MAEGPLPKEIHVYPSNTDMRRIRTHYFDISNRSATGTSTSSSEKHRFDLILVSTKELTLF